MSYLKAFRADFPIKKVSLFHVFYFNCSCSYTVWMPAVFHPVFTYPDSGIFFYNSNFWDFYCRLGNYSHAAWKL